MAKHHDSVRNERDFGPLLADLLADPLSALTRSRQTSLLTAATITLLLAYGYANLRQEPSGVLSLINTSSRVAAWLGVALTLYLLVTYALYIWTDLKIARLKGWFQRGAVADIDAKMKKDREQRRELSKSRIEKVFRLKTEADAIRASFRGQSKPLWDRSDEVARQLDAMPQYGLGSEQRRTLEGELKGIQDQLSALAATQKERLAIPEAALDDLAKRSTLDDVWAMLHEVDALTAGRQTVRNAT